MSVILPPRLLFPVASACARLRYGKLAFIALFMLVLEGCSSTPKTNAGRYSIEQDHGPRQHVDLSSVPDAVPRFEPKSRGGNKSSYEVFGKRYYVMDSARGYQQTGTASWYGKKFHGHKTANGETYDMYAMSAAHKSLPLPAYVRVTNLANNKQVIVRVNDRGPFHGNRLIDLSYAAAYKLDMLKTGTARVRVEVIDASSPVDIVKQSAPPVVTQPQATPSPAGGQYVQVGAYSSWSSAQAVKIRMETLFNDLGVHINKADTPTPIYRVQLGPVGGLNTTNGVFNVLRSSGFGDARLVDLP